MFIRTTAEAARELGLQLWQIRTIVDRDLPPPQRFGMRRVLDTNMYPAIRTAAIRRGWLPKPPKSEDPKCL